MRKLIASLCVASLVAGAGCNTSPSGGRPSGAPKADGGTTARKETFKLHGPELATKVKQGATEKFNLSISRDSAFKDDVAIKVDAPADSKLSVSMEPNAFKASEDKKVEVAVKAADDAPLGKHTLKVTGSPQSGSPTMLDVTVEVVAKEKNK